MNDPSIIGYRKDGRPIFVIAGGDGTTEPVVEDQPQPSVEDIVTRAADAAVKALRDEMAAARPDLSKIAGPVSEEETEVVESKALRRELDKALHIDRDYADVPEDKRPAGIGFTRWAKLSILATSQSVNVGVRRQAEARLAELTDMATKATGGLLEGTNSVGGFIVPVIYETDMIPLLRAKSVVRAIGPVLFPMREKIHNLPRQSGAGTAYWLGEAGQVTASNQAFQQVVLTAKDLLALTFFSNDLLMDSHPAADQVVRDDLIQIIALAEDKAFLIGGANISANAPSGIYKNTAANTYAVQSGVTEIALGGALPSVDDLQNAVYQLRNANVNFLNVAWVMAPREAYGLRKLKDANGLPILRDASTFTLGGNQVALGVNGGRAPSGNLLGYPVWETTQMPADDSKAATNQGGALILGDFSEAIVGDRMQPEVAATSEATVLDPDGSTNVNLFSTNQSAIRVVERLDFQLRHAAAFVVVSGCTAP